MRPNSRGSAFVVPLLLLVLAGFNVPVLYMLSYSVVGRDGLTLDHYRTLIEATVYLKVLGNTLRVALVATLAIVLVGYPLAYWISGFGRRGQAVAMAMVVLPFWVSVLVRTYAWIVILGNAGMLNRLLQWLGLTREPVGFLYNELGVTIGMANVLLPFLVLPLYASMVRIDKRLTQAAASLGASRLTIFWRVFFPLTVPALAAGAVLVFILCLGFYVTPAILGGGKVPMVANMLDILINRMPRWEVASAISTLLLAATLAFFAAYRRLDRAAGA